jgi:hypothetical protein
LKSSISQQSNQRSKNIFLFDKNEFEKQRLNQIPHHFLERSGSQLKWIESTRDLSIILKHIDESNPQKFSEGELSNSPSHIVILSDIAGMGKSSLFYKLAEISKEYHPDYWIYKLDLNDHSEGLEKLTKTILGSPEEAVKFLGEKIMKFKSDFEENHFTRSCIETGKVILLIDGVDEIFSSYGEEVLDMIKLLSQTKIKKLFISTRPECCERLEMEFLQIKHSLEPFSESDQKQYFLDFLKNNDKLGEITEAELRETVEAFMESMKGSISAKDYRHTGVPLMTKLVAEYLENKCFCPGPDGVTLSETMETLKTEKFNLWILYENFIIKSFIIYFRDKCEMDVDNAMKLIEMRKKEKKILENYKIFAILQFLNRDMAAKFFPNFANKKFSDLEIEEMEKVGLIYKTDDGYKFVHQTFAENLFTWHLMENFEQPKVAEFIVHFVFIDPKFEVIQTFVDHWIEDKKSLEVYDLYFDEFLRHTPTMWTPFHILTRSKTLDFFYNCLTKSSKFNNQKAKVQKYLLKSQAGLAPIFAVIVGSESFYQILDSVKNDFGSKFVLDIFRIEVTLKNNIMTKNGNLLLYTSCKGHIF